MSKSVSIALIAIALGVLLPAGCGVTSYNRLNGLEQGVDAQWAQVQNVYQRRLDLVPNLVETVMGAAAFEKETFTAVTEARGRAAGVAGVAATDPAALKRFQDAQEQLGSALSRLLVVVERYPDLHATQAFRDLQAQLEGTENRITVERMRFNDVAREFNTARNSFPTVLFAGFFGPRFQDKAYFQATAEAQTAPKVKF